MSDKNVQLLVACHKPCETPSDSIYLPMHVGSKGKEAIPGFTRDDSGDNISEKNPVYCELTGLYWAWKHLDCDYLGLVHYRRYFTEKPRVEQKKIDPLECVLTEKEITELLSRYRILLPKKRQYYVESIYSHYAHTFDGSQLDKTRKILEDHKPEYVNAFDCIMKQTGAYIFNMYVMPKTLSDQYCTWLFAVLEELEKQVDTSSMTDFEKRYVGRVSERLLNVWLLHQIETGAIKRNEIGEVPYLYLGEVDWKRKVSGFIQAKLFGKKYDKSF